MSRLKALLSTSSSIKAIILLFIISQSFLLAMMLYTFPKINSVIQTNAFDLKTFGYSFLEAKSILSKLNEQTTNLYLFPQLTFFDLFYPFLLALFLSSILYRLMNKTKSKNKIYSIVYILPFLAMAFDYLENTCILLLITQFIQINEPFVYVSSTFTILKGLLTTISWILILYYSAKWVNLKMKLRSKRITLH